MKELLAYKLIEDTIGISIEIISNEYQETPSAFGEIITHHKVVFQVQEKNPDVFAIDILFVLSLMSFTFADPSYSDIYFIPDEEWNLSIFMEGLQFESGNLVFSADYICGRLVNTEIEFRQGGKVKITTRNRGKDADRWLFHLQGKKHIHDIPHNSHFIEGLLSLMIS